MYQVEGLCHVRLGQFLHAVGANLFIHAGEVVVRDRQFNTLKDHHAHAAGTDHAAQALVAVHQVLQRLIHRAAFKISLEDQRHAFHICTVRIVAHFRGGEHFHLRLRGGNGTLDRGTGEGIEVHFNVPRFRYKFLHDRPWTCQKFLITVFPRSQA